MKPHELTDPGPEFRGLRQKVAVAVDKVNAHKSVYAVDLKAMLEEAALAVEVPEEEVPEEE